MIGNRWKPQQEVVNAVYSFIEKQYPSGKIPDGYESFLFELAKISAFLKDNEAVLTQLKKLNALLLEEKVKNRPLISDECSGYFKYKVHKHNKVLRNVLERELEKLGFQPDLSKALNYLPPKIFRFCLSQGILIKDPLAGQKHGEFTHPIQWLIIGWQQKDSNFLNNSIIKIFNELGSERSIIYTKGQYEFNLWDVSVDQTSADQSERGEYDCRSPEYLHDLILLSSDPDLSLLKDLSSSRVEKRNHRSLFKTADNNRTYPKKEYERSDQNEDLLIAKNSIHY